MNKENCALKLVDEIVLCMFIFNFITLRGLYVSLITLRGLYVSLITLRGLYVSLITSRDFCYRRFVAFILSSSLCIQQRIFFSPSHALNSFTCVN